MPHAPAPSTATFMARTLARPPARPARALLSARALAASAMLPAMRFDPRRFFPPPPPALVGVAAASSRRRGPRWRLLAELGVQARRPDQRSVELHPSPQHHELRPGPVLPADDDAQRAAQADARRQRHRSLLPAALHAADARQRRPLGPVRRLRLRVDGAVEEGDVHVRGDPPVQPGLQVRRRQLDLRVLRHALGLGAGLSRRRRSSSPSPTSCRTGSPRSPTPSVSRWCPASSRRGSPSSRTRAGARTSASATCRSASGPFHPYDVHGAGRVTYENLRTRGAHGRARLHRPHHRRRLRAGHLHADAPRRDAGGRRVRRPEVGRGRFAAALLSVRARGPARVPAAIRGRRASRRRISACSAAFRRVCTMW